MQKKYMVRCDVEGVTGVTTYEQAKTGALGRAMLANDLSAAIDGLLSAGQCEIVVYDEHTDGRNVCLDNMPDMVSVIAGKPPYQEDWGGIDSSYDALLMIGFHARAGVEGALLHHSYALENRNLWLNGKVIGEIGMEAAIAGDFGVPLYLVTGDSAGVAEAEALIPGVKTVAVKEAMGEFAARCYPPSLTKKWIYTAAQEVAQTPPDVQPLKIDSPVNLRIELSQSGYLTKVQERYKELFIDLNTLELTGSTVTAVWAKYQRMLNEVGIF